MFSIIGNIIGNVRFVFGGDAARMRDEYENLLASTAQINVFIGQIMMMLNRRGSLTEEELAQMLQHYTQLASPNLNSALLEAQKKRNPLTPNEANRLEYYMDKANRRIPFLAEEIDDYRQLVEKAKWEQIREMNPWPLIALGGFLLGLWLGSQAKEEPPK